MDELTDRVRMEIVPELEEKLKLTLKTIYINEAFTKEYKKGVRYGLLHCVMLLNEILDNIDEIEKSLDEMEEDNKNIPKIGDKRFLMHREVIVTKVYSLFRLIKVRYTGETMEFCVDACALTNEPDYTNSISLGLFKNKEDKQ